MDTGNRALRNHSNTRQRWPKTGLAALVAATLVGATGFFGCGSQGDNPPEQVPPVSSRHGDESEEADEKPSTSAILSSDRTPPRSAPIVSDLPRPETIQDLIEEAERTADRLERSFPDDPDAVELRARTHFYVGRHAAAVECWERCLKHSPQYGYAYHGMGLVAAKEADYEKAVILQRKAVEFAPWLPDAVIKLADSLTKLDRPGEAIEVLEKHQPGDFQSLQAQLALGRAYLQNKDYEKSRDAYGAALDTHGDSAAAEFGLATALTRLGQREESTQAMERYKELAANDLALRARTKREFDDLQSMCVDLASSFSIAGAVCLAHGDADQAEAVCRRAAVLDPTNTQCRVQLASLYQRTDRGEQALGVCRQLVEIQPENWGYHLNLGTMCGNLGQFEDAERAFQEVCRLAPQRPDGHAALARLYVRSGRKLEDAVTAAEKALELDPGNPQHRKTLELARKAQ